ncbi:phage major tail protein, TP901-1 family [Planococcus sp. X10-3]|uniref:phage major tail protein, TP901-1 family n=1 Tax=Planococcus sp. X10-3 TaxID=3061240 RepID=UPI003BAFD424
MAFENNLYCDLTDGASQAMAGKDIILAIFDATGADLLAVAGQQGLTINRSKDSIEVTSKDSGGGWKKKIGGMKEWSIDNDGLYVPSHASHKALSAAFNNDELLCIKVLDQKNEVGMFGGLASLTDYSLEAPYDDAMTYSASLDGSGELVDLLEDPETGNMMPGDEEPVVVV